MISCGCGTSESNRRAVLTAWFSRATLSIEVITESIVLIRSSRPAQPMYVRKSLKDTRNPLRPGLPARPARSRRTIRPDEAKVRSFVDTWLRGCAFCRRRRVRMHDVEASRCQ
jgi:hypothetical protein